MRREADAMRRRDVIIHIHLLMRSDLKRLAAVQLLRKAHVHYTLSVFERGHAECVRTEARYYSSH